MSKTIAHIASGMLDLTTLPLNKRQRGKVRARVANKIQQNFESVPTPHGFIKLLSGRGSTLASTVANWENEEPETRHWIDTYMRDGDVFWDIGANVGVFSLYAAQAKSLDIYAFEPSTLNFSLLVEHMALNNMAQSIKALPLAFSDHTGMETLYFKSSEAGAACNALNEAQDQFSVFTPELKHEVLVFSVDDFIKNYSAAAPTHIKLDVDGIEKLILKGAKQTLQSVETLMIEIEGHNENDEQILELIAAAGLKQDESIKGMGNGRNRLFIRDDEGR